MTDRLIASLVCLGAAVALFLLTGCKDSGRSDSIQKQQTEDALADTLTAEQIWQETLDRYQQAEAYSDSAVLYVSYRIQDNLIQEPKPWSVKYRKSGELEAGIFNSEIQAADGRISCFVYDIGTGNLDGQNLVRSFDQSEFLGGLTRDEIALHFLSGANDLPVAKGSTYELIPPTLSLLSADSRHTWLTQPTAVKRFKDDLVENVPCHVVRVFGNHRGKETVTDVWVGKQDGLVWQMLLPNSFLADELNDAAEITDLQLIARFNDAKFACEDRISVKERPEATPVKQFVRLPESLPSELIGQPVNPFQLMRPDGTRWSEHDLVTAKPTVMAWFVGSKSRELLEALAPTQVKIGDSVDFKIVFSDDIVVESENGLEIPRELQSSLSTAGLSWLYDSGLDACSALRIDAVPALVVLEAKKVVYAQKLDQATWANELLVAIERIRSGDDVAREMLAEYQQFLESYAERLAQQSSTGPMRLAKFKSQRPKAKAVAKRLLWELPNIKEPGNIYEAGNGDLLVFDGWQSIVRCDRNGAVVGREILPVPEGYAANRIAFGTENIAVYQASGRTVFVLDPQWRRLGTYPGSNSSLSPVTFASLESRQGREQLLVGFARDGVHTVQLANGEGAKRSDVSLTSATPNVKFGVSNGRLVAFDVGTNEAKQAGSNRYRWRLVDKYIRGNYWGIAENDEGHDNVVIFDAEGGRFSPTPIGEFVVETDSVLLNCRDYRTFRLGAILARPDELLLLRNEKELVGVIKSEEPIQGFRLIGSDGKPKMLISTSAGLRCFEILDANK